MTLIQCKGEGRFAERAREELCTSIYDYGCLRSCDLIHPVDMAGVLIVNSIKDSLINEDS